MLDLFGEAAMFTTRNISNGNGTIKVGFNSRLAPDNQEFEVSLMKYLTD